MNTPVIYAIVNTHNGHRYIGSTVNLEKRIKKHFYDLLCGNHHSTHLQHAYDKYGRDAFEVMVLEECLVDNIAEREQHHIDSIPANERYNICPVAYSSLGRKISEETRAKMSIAKKNISEATRAKMSTWKRNAPSEETRAKISIAHKGVKRSEEDRIKMAQGWARRRAEKVGKPVVEKQPIARKPRTHSAETKRKLSIAGKLRKHSEETKAKISLAGKARYKRKNADQDVDLSVC